MTVQAKGHAPDLRIFIVAPNLPPVEFRLGPPRSFRGRVIDLAGAPIAGTSVSVDTWRSYRSLTIKTETDLEGRFQVDDLPDDPVEFQFSKEGFMNLPNQRWSPGAIDAVVNRETAADDGQRAINRLLPCATGDTGDSFRTARIDYRAFSGGEDG